MSSNTTASERLLEVSNKLWDAMYESGEVPTYAERAHYYLALKDAMDENAKLRELGGEVASILFNLDVDRCGLCQRDSISHPCPVHTVKGGECLYKTDLRDLGIEVDE